MAKWVAVLYAVGLVTGLGGVTLVVLDWRSNHETISRWRAANPMNNEQGSYGQMLMINEVVNGLIGTTWRRVVAVILLFLAVLLEAIGNFLGLAV